jgi:hypothetical protein
LADVAPLWATGELRAAGLDARAVRTLVGALFEDTPARRAALTSIN